MKQFLFLVAFSLFSNILIGQNSKIYNEDYVKITSTSDYNILNMFEGKSSGRIKAKYFAAPDTYSNKSVYQRFNDWKIGKNVISVSSGTYMTDYSIPKGLTIDNGVLVNEKIEDWDGLVIVYNTGGIVASNLEDKNLTVQGFGNYKDLTGKNLDLKNNRLNDKYDFLDWAKKESATVFQTHLLIYKNELLVDRYTSSNKLAERRFLVVGKDEDNTLVYMIVDFPVYSTIYDASSKLLDFLKYKKDMVEVTFVINLDPGAQNVLEIYKSDGTVYDKMKGELELNKAVNLLVFYYD